MSHSSALPPLTRRYKWRVALSLTLIYYPILLYLDFVHGDYARDRLSDTLLLDGLGAGLILLTFRGWVHAVEWVQSRLYRWLGEDFSLDMSWPGQLLTLTVCIVLGAIVLLVYGGAMHTLGVLLTGAGPTARHGADTSAGFGQLCRSLDGYVLMLTLSVFYLLANGRAQQRLLAAASRSQQLEMENAQVQLAALKNQVNPHFLFNSLSILSSLVHIDPDMSEKFIDQLARAYRYTLEQQQQDVVPLHTEMAFIQSYIFLLKIRFREKFEVVLDVPEETRAARGIAPLTLQLLVENAVKHNTMSQARPLRVSIRQQGDALLVGNYLQRRAATYDSTNVGLANIQSRYRLLTDRPVQVVETAEVFEVRIPLLAV